MIILKNGRGQLGEELKSQLTNLKIIPTEDVFIYHTWDMESDKNNLNAQRECFARFREFVHFNSKKKIFFISTYSSKHNFYNMFKQQCESYLMLNGDQGYNIKLPTLTGKGICDKLKKGTAKPYGVIELMSSKEAAKQILEIVEEVLTMDKKEPISKSYRLYGTKVPAELVQELVKDE
tara:strand:+ start:329 stop:862 length:534 start_codon:yes stop_codon:yes gene_type:complete